MANMNPTRRQKPEYKAEKVDELPDDVVMPRSGPRTDPTFTEAMLVAQSDPNSWYCVGTYRSEQGAKTMAKRIMIGRGGDTRPIEIQLPKGEWDFETRRIESPNANGRWSKLYAKFLG
jgi:hypothetical protein